MTPMLELAYVSIAVPDPASLSPFFGEVIGLVPGQAGRDGSLAWRNDDKVHRVMIERGDANDVSCLGFEAVDESALTTIVDRLTKAGYPVVEANADDRADRRVDRLIRTIAPWGTAVEACTQLALASTPFESPLVLGGFLTNGVGFGHAVIATTAFDESVRFLTEGLGMVQSDWVDMTIAEGIELQIRFFHCNARHHSVALAHAPFELPSKLHHIMFETVERDDVGGAFDRAWDAGLGIPNGLGTHDNDRTFSFYVQSPAGFLVEVGHGARTIADDWSGNRRYDRASIWGHQALRSAM